MLPLLIRYSSRANWQVYLGVGILSALTGYFLSAMPQLILPIACVCLGVWLIDCGVRENTDGAMAPSPLRLLSRCMPWLIYQQSCLVARWWQLRYFADRQRHSWWKVSYRRPWLSRESH